MTRRTPLIINPNQDIIQQLRAMVALWDTQCSRTKPAGYRRLLGWNADAKTKKGQTLGYLTGILYLAAHEMSGVINLCQFATNCINVCLVNQGRARVHKSINRARIAKTEFFVREYLAFLASLAFDIHTLIRTAERTIDESTGKPLVPVVRLNGTSDQPKIAMLLSQVFGDIQFYDYTKCPKPWLRQRLNYHLTFSYDGDVNVEHCLDALKHGINVAVVFNIRPGKPFPETWYGFPVVSGDKTDCRFLDAPGHVIALYAKGTARKDCSGFVVQSTHPSLIQIKAA